MLSAPQFAITLKQNKINFKMLLLKHVRPIHPFPAHMAPEVVWDELPSDSVGSSVLDRWQARNYFGTARLRGHIAIGFDRDPLAVLLSSTWTANIHPGF